MHFALGLKDALTCEEGEEFRVAWLGGWGRGVEGGGGQELVEISREMKRKGGGREEGEVESGEGLEVRQRNGGGGGRGREGRDEFLLSGGSDWRER